MASTNVAYQSVAIKYGILVGVAHIIYFVLMWIFGLLDVIELSFISGLFLIIGISVAISRFKRIRGGTLHYLQGLGIGATVGVVSSAILALFLLIFLSIFRTGYIREPAGERPLPGKPDKAFAVCDYHPVWHCTGPPDRVYRHAVVQTGRSQHHAWAEIR